MGGISADDDLAVEKLTKKLEGLESQQATMKAVNAYFRKHKTLDGCPELTPEQAEKLKADMAQSWHLDITKPFSMLILGKRITALLRRSQSKPAVNMIKLGDVTVDFSGYTACDENGKIDITPKELEILKVLIDNKGLVLSRNQILDEVWGYDCDVIDRTIDAYIRNIRKKLRLDCITTVKGIGYKFEMGQEI